MKHYVFLEVSHGDNVGWENGAVNRYARDGYTIESITPLSRGSATLFATKKVLVVMSKDAV